MDIPSLGEDLVYGCFLLVVDHVGEVLRDQMKA
jgi:hypothetical protein